MKALFYFQCFSFLLVSCYDKIPVGEPSKSDKQLFYGNWESHNDETFASFQISENIIFCYFLGEYIPNNLMVNGTKLGFLNTQFQQDENKTYFSSIFDFSELYGKFISVESEEDSFKILSSEIEKSSSIYIPKLLEIEVSNLNNGRLVTGGVLNWNIDDINSKGVLLSIYFEYLKQDEGFELPSNYDVVIEVTRIIEESGEYIFKEEDLAVFPSNAKLSIGLSRICNGEVVGLNSEKDFTIRAISSKSINAYLK